MQDIIKQWPILSLLPMCTTDAGLSINSHLIAVSIMFDEHKYLLINKYNKSSSTYDQYSFVHIW